MAYEWMWYETSLPREISQLIARDVCAYEGGVEDGLVFDREATSTGVSNEKIRSTKVSFIPDSHWICGVVMHYANKVNNSNFHYDLTGLDFNTVQYGIYDVGDHYDWHNDYCLSNMSQSAMTNGHGSSEERACALVTLSSELVRKLSFSLQLTDKEDYEGGALEIVAPNGEVHQIKQELGTIVFFDSRVVHRVAPVTRGQRRSLVGWIVGPRWK